MSEKIEIELKYKIGDKVKKDTTGEIFEIKSWRYLYCDGLGSAIEYFAGGSSNVSCLEQYLTLVPPPLTILEIMRRATEISENTLSSPPSTHELAQAHDLVRSIAERGITV